MQKHKFLIKKLFIKNRKGQNLSVLIERSKNQSNLAFVMHGLGGFKEQDHIQVFAEAFKEKNFTVIRFDTTNALGESDGRYEDATITSYYEDLEDIIEWAKGQEWYQEPFVLSGHSFGSFCATFYAERHPREVMALAPISPFISGKLSVEAHKHYSAEEFKKWKETGWLIEESVSKPGVIKKLPWSHIKNRLKYDLLSDVQKLKMPVLLIVGEKDISIPLEHVQLLYDSLSGKKELHIIKEALHTFRDKKQFKEIKEIFLNWIEKNL